MTHLLTPLNPVRRVRSALLACMATASLVLLGGCSIWPKMLTIDSSPEPVSAASPVVAKPVVIDVAPVAPVPVVPVAVAPVATTAPVLSQPASVPTPEPMPASPAPTSVTAPALPAAPPSRALAVTASDMVPGYYINVGLFAKPVNGQSAFLKLERAGFAVFSDSVMIKNQILIRVRVGPYISSDQAKTAGDKIRTLGLDALVFKK
jgi:cell division septation protein DedD